MKRIELTSFPDKQEYIENFLDKQQVPFQRFEGKTSEDRLLYRYIIIAPDDLANSIVQTFSKIIDTKERELYITNENIEATVSDYLHQLKETITPKKKIPQLIEELIPLTEPFVRFRRDLAIMIIISCAVALVGLFSNSPAIVIGAMLISPLLGPITAFAFNAAVGRPWKMLQSAFSGFVLIATVVLASAVLTFLTGLIFDLPITNEIEIRTKNSPVDVMIGILLGIAGGIAMVSTIPGILVGVAIAAALVPPATVTGIGIAFFDYEIFTGGLLLTSSNIIGLILGCMIVFFLKGVTPRKYYERSSAKKYLLISIIFFAFLGLLLGVFSIF
ncbi:MAG TPA: TIGR00341 family protein [Candidatus Nitrosotenuis sp.]|nr:TIGR00341 family protein [Candidatus Nitrosotenuis sp.]